MLCRREHQGPASHEVGMEKSAVIGRGVGGSIKDPPLTRWVWRDRARGAVCRLEHQGLTSHEAGMEKREPHNGCRFQPLAIVSAFDYNIALLMPRTIDSARSNR